MSQTERQAHKEEIILDDDSEEMKELDYNFKITDNMNKDEIRNGVSEFTNHEKTKDDVHFAYETWNLLESEWDVIKSITIQREETNQQKLFL